VNHLIHRVDVELRARTRATAIAAQEATSRAFQHDLPAALEAAFDARSPNAKQRLDRLEIDLGTLPARGFRQALIAALIESLTNIDANRITSRPAVRLLVSPQSVVSAAQPESDDVVQAFLYYVVQGSLPWFFTLERWQDEIPEALTSTAVFPELRARLPALVRENAMRLLRLLPFPNLATALFTSEFPAAVGTETLTRTSLPASSIEARIRLALWFLHLSIEESELDSHQESTLLRVLGINQGNVLSPKPDDSQRVISALPEFPGIAKPPEVARLARLIARTWEPHDSRAEKGIESRTPQSSPIARELLENGIPTESAGIVLLHPFLVRFFQLLGWLDDDLRIRAERRWHAVHALHEIAHKRAARDEVSLSLEKALCGIPMREAASFPEVEDGIRGEADSLLRAVIGHWKALRDTSPDGLREAFLARPGLLYLDEPPRLHVETRSYDMLLSRLPWSFELVAFPWLRHPIHVRWPAPS
jgi:hypothetical protein